MMRVAAFVHQFPSVSQTFVLNQITGLIERGHALEIFAERRGAEQVVHADVKQYSLGACTHYYNIPPNYFLRVAHALPKFARRVFASPLPTLGAMNVPRYGVEAASLRMLYEIDALGESARAFDIAHCHFGPNGLIGAKLRDVGALRGKLVTSFYGYDVSEKQYAHAYAFLFAHGDLFLALSENMRAQLVALGCDARKIRIHRLGIDPNVFCPQPRAPRSELHLLTIARFVAKKGLDYALRAVAKLRLQFPNLRYAIVGDGVQRPALEALIAELNLRETVALSGWKTQRELLELLQDSDILVTPSVTAPNGDAEGTPVVLMEAMALERAVIATRHGGIPEIITHDESGWLVPERDVDALAQGLETLCASAALRARLGQAARASILRTHNIHTLNVQLEELYAESV